VNASCKVAVTGIRYIGALETPRIEQLAMSYRWFLASDHGTPRGVAPSSAREDDPSVVDAAIARVLAAEASARKDVEAAALEADALLDDARRRAREIGDRAERRVRTARSRYDAAVRSEVARIEAEAAAQETEHALTAEDREHVARAVATVAGDLTGEP
jgi:vacuolar-type H+-ATPase subunit H